MKIVPNIFKIEKTHNQLKALDSSYAIILSILTHSHRKNNKNFDSESLKVSSYTNGDVKYFLYTYKINDKESDWADFLPNELKENDSFTQTKLNLILFIEAGYNLFAVVGGSSYWLIANYIDHLFGLITYDRIISLENDEAVSTKSRAIIGQRAGMSEQFRDDYRMINYLQFGKIPKELHIKLANDTSLTHFNFLLIKPSEKLQVAAGRSFRINKEVDFNYLHSIVEELSLIMTLAPKELLSSYIQVRDSQTLIELRNLLHEKIYNSIAYIINQSDDPRDIFEFDFCNPNKIEEFYEAERYELVEPSESGKRKDGTFATVSNKNDIYKTVLEKAYNTYGDNKQGIVNYLYGVTVHCCVGRKSTASSGFMYHFNAEFTLGDDAVFLVDSKWYILKESFIESLKGQTERILRNSKLVPGILDQTWIYDTIRKRFSNEGGYNMQYDGRSGYMVLDTIIADGIELCDILFIIDNELYLIHVKHSFTSRVRELTNQILISARRLREAISSKQRSFFDSLYDGLLSKGRSTNNLTKNDFYNLFLVKKPIYVFATASQLEVDLPIESNMDKYDSNIARFSLTTCSGEMQTNYYELKTYQIQRA